MNIFKRSYKVRRYGRTSWEDGVASAGYEDVQLMLDVQAKTRRNQDDPAGRTTTGNADGVQRHGASPGGV